MLIYVCVWQRFTIPQCDYADQRGDSKRDYLKYKLVNNNIIYYMESRRKHCERVYAILIYVSRDFCTFGNVAHTLAGESVSLMENIILI